MGTGRLCWHQICLLHIRSLLPQHLPAVPGTSSPCPRLSALGLCILLPVSHLSPSDAPSCPLISRPDKPQHGLQEPQQKLLGHEHRQAEVLPASCRHRLPAGLSERYPALHLPKELWRRLAGSKHPERAVHGGWRGEGSAPKRGMREEGSLAATGAWQGLAWQGRAESASCCVPWP